MWKTPSPKQILRKKGIYRRASIIYRPAISRTRLDLWVVVAILKTPGRVMCGIVVFRTQEFSISSCFELSTEA